MGVRKARLFSAIQGYLIPRVAMKRKALRFRQTSKEVNEN
jgi:hypothetical protein